MAERYTIWVCEDCGSDADECGCDRASSSDRFQLVEVIPTSSLTALADENERLNEALHDRKTWTFDTLLYVADRLLGEFYPDDIFPDVPEEDEKGDPGPQLIRAIRRCRRTLSTSGHPTEEDS